MKVIGLFRWQDKGNVYFEHFESQWIGVDSSDRLLRISFYEYLKNNGVFFHNLELIESKIEP